MWWAVPVNKLGRSSKTVGVQGAFSCAEVLNHLKPTQMAIPLQMDEFPERLVAAMWRVEWQFVMKHNLRSRP
jgi:hypothetical protein